MNTPNGGDASTSTPRKKLPVKPSLEHLHKQAKRRVKLQPTLKLAEAQHQLAREYGCKNWAQLARMVETMLRGADQLAYVKMDFEPLAQAAREVDIRSVREILSRGEFTQHDLDQALARSLWYGEEDGWRDRKEIADLLLEHGADPDGQYGSDYGPIVFGTGECLQPSGLQYLIDAGADVTFGRIRTKYGDVCLFDHVLGTYNRGRNERKHRMIEILLAHGAYVPSEIAPPIMAIHRGDARTLGTLLDADPTLLRRTFADMPYGNISLRGASLLHCAVEFGEIACAEELFKRVADINIKADVIDGLGGQTPIFHAINTNGDGNFPMLEYLAERVSPWVDMSIRATWTAYGEPQRKPMTPFEYAQSADTPEARKWRKCVDEELAIVGSLDGTEQLKQALLRKDADAANRLLDERPALMNPSLWPHAIFQAKSVEMTRLLLDRGLHPDECTAPRKPLHLAVYQCLPDIVELLIERGADVNLRNPLGETPLDLLNAYEPRPVGDPDAERIRKALREAGAKDDFLTVIRAGEVDAVRALLQEDPSLARSDSDLGGPLFVAARSGRVEVARLLLEAGADPNKVNSKGNTPLWFAAQSPARPASARIAVMGLLLDAGADIHKRCEDGTTALHFAAWRGPVEVVEYLLSRGARPWTTDDKDRTPKDHAVQMSNSPDKEDIVRLFSEVRVLDPVFRSAVAALDAGDVEVLRAILREHPGLVRQRAEEEGWFAGVYFRHPTLLHFVANNPYRHEVMPPRTLECAEVILDAGAEVDATTEAENAHTVLGLVTSCEPARKAGLQIPLIEFLVRRGADPTRGLDSAVIHGEDEAVACLLRLGARHTLMSAAAHGDDRELKKLLKNVGSREKMSAAMAAARYGRIASVDVLLKSGLGISERMTSHPYSPTLLHQAAWFGQRELAEWLIARGADLSIRDTQFNGTPAGWAKYGEHPEHAAWFAAQEKPTVDSVLAALDRIAAEIAPELDRHHLLSLTGVWLNSAALKIQKAHWNDGAGHQTFFSVWADAKDLKRGRFKYNIHALKMRLLPGYSMSAGDFASGFRKRFAKAGGNWPNVRVDYGPQTLMEGWMPFDVKTFSDDVIGLVNGFIAIHGIIDEVLEGLRIK